jgi:outer membrane protein TolC
MKAVHALLLGLGVCACATPADDTRYTQMSREWRSAGPRVAGAGEPDGLFAGAARLERDELVRQVLERNPSLAAAHFAWLAALERYPQARALDDPMLGYSIAPRTLGASGFDPSQRFDLSQRLPFPGKRALAGAAALAEAEASAHDFATARIRLAALASALFDDYYLAARALAINREHADLLQIHFKSALARYASGSGSQQDPLQAEVEIAQLARQALELRNRSREAQARINALLRRAPELPLPPPPERLRVPALPAGDGPSAAAVGSRPDLAAAAARVRARAAELAGAQRAFLPDLTLMGSYDQLWEEKELRPMLGFEIELPLQLARRRAGVREARARLAQAEHEALGAADGARLELLRARQELERARELRRLFDEQLLPTARERVAAARAGFESGRGDFAELVDAEHGLRELRLGAEEALADESRRSAELAAALGRLPGAGGERP